MLKNLRAIAIWLLPPLVVVALPTEAPGLTCLAMIYLYVGGVLLAIRLLISFFATRNKPHAASALLIVVMIWLLAWQYGFTVGARIHLTVNQSRYLETLEQLSRARLPAEQDRICGDTCTSYPDRIVIFHYCHCPFNWPDIVYDRNDNLEAPREELQKISLYLHGSKRLSKFWYIGYFGD